CRRAFRRRRRVAFCTDTKPTRSKFEARVSSSDLQKVTTLYSARNGWFVMKRLILIPLLFLWAQATVAASPIIVDGDYVAAAIARNAGAWDVRTGSAYAKGHIAGAINIGDAPKVLRDENTEDFI